MNRNGKAAKFLSGDGEEELQPAPRRIPSLASLFHVLWLKKWPMLIVWAVLALPTGLALSIFNLPKSYTAATVLRFPSVVGAQTNVMRDMAITQGESIISIFGSFQVLQATSDKLGLMVRIISPNLFSRFIFKSVHYTKNPDLGRYTINLEGRGVVSMLYRPRKSRTEYLLYRGALQDNKLAVAGLELELTPNFLRGLHGPQVQMEASSLEETVLDLKKSLATRPLGSSNFEIKLKDRDPWLVAEILNTLRQEFLTVYYGTTEVQDVGILVQMEKDLGLAKEKLDKSQDELSKYYAAHPELMRQETSGAGNSLVYLETRQQAETTRRNRQRVAEAMAAKDENTSPEKKYFWAIELLSSMSEAGEGKANILRASLTDLNTRQTGYRNTLGPEHPRIAEAERDKEAIYRQIEQAEAQLMRKLDRELTDLRLKAAGSAPSQTVVPIKVQLEVERLNGVNKNNEEIYNRLLESYNRAKLVTGSEFFKVTVVDQARPALYEAPSLKARLLIAVAAVVVLLLLIPGGYLGWLLVFIRIWTKDDLQTLLDIKPLGEVPLRKATVKDDDLFQKSSGLDPLLLYHGRDYQLEDVECFRIIREEAENTFRNPAHPGRYCIMFTSSHPHEGKSTCASNLAVTFARKGKRTLLVDADFRLGRIARIFNLQVGTGLDEVLGRSDLSPAQFLDTATQTFLNTRQRNLVVAPRKFPDPDAGEIASSDRFIAFIKMVREQFDVVIIDAPPVIITPEPLSMAEATDGIIFVCRSGNTTAAEAREAISILRDRRVPMAAILNGVKDTPFHRSRYRKYSYYYQVQPKPGGEGGGA